MIYLPNRADGYPTSVVCDPRFSGLSGVGADGAIAHGVKAYGLRKWTRGRGYIIECNAPFVCFQAFLHQRSARSECPGAKGVPESATAQVKERGARRDKTLRWGLHAVQEDQKRTSVLYGGMWVLADVDAVEQYDSYRGSPCKADLGLGNCMW